MSFLRTSLIACLALGLGLYIYLYEAPKMASEGKGEHLVTVQPAQIDRIELSYPDDKPVELVKKDGVWRLTAPVDAPADQHAVEMFLNVLHDAVVERRIPKDEAEAPATYGLDSPTGTRARVELTVAGGRKLPAIVVGNTTPVDFHAFVRVEGSDDVLLTPLIFHTSIKKTGFDFRDKTLLHLESQSITALTIEKDGATVRLEKKPEGWTLTAPITDRADDDTVRSLVGSVPTIQAIAYYDGTEVDRAKFGLDDPTMTVTAKLDDQGKVAFKLGATDQAAPAGTYFERIQDGPGADAGTTGAVAKVADWVTSTYGVEVPRLRDRRLVRCDPDDVVKVTYTSDGDTFTLSREAAGKPWSIEPAADGASVVQRITDSAVRNLAELKGDDVVGDATDAAARAAYALDKPLARVELSTGSGECGGIIGSSKDPGAETPVYYLQSDDRSAVLTGSASQMSRVSMKRSEFVEMKPPAAGAPAGNEANGSAAGAPAGTGSAQAGPDVR